MYILFITPDALNNRSCVLSGVIRLCTSILCILTAKEKNRNDSWMILVVAAVGSLVVVCAIWKHFLSKQASPSSGNTYSEKSESSFVFLLLFCVLL